jgi:hypothetical protein
MATRSSLVAMLLAVPLLVAVLVGFSGGIGTLPFGISSLASGPSIESSGIPPGTTPTQNLSGLVTPAGTAGVAVVPTAAGGTATVGGDGNPGPGAAAPPGVTPAPPAPPAAGETRQPGGSATDSGGGSAAGPVNPPADPGEVTGDPAGAVNNAVGQVQEAVGALVEPPR